MEESSSDDIPPSSHVGTSGEVSSVAFDLARQNLATVTSEGTIAIFSRTDKSEEWQLFTEWKTENQFPLTQVAWAHPEFGSLLAVGGSDGEVSLWRRCPSTQGDPPDSPTGAAAAGGRAFRSEGSVSVRGGVTALAFGAKERGLHLAVASTTCCSVLRARHPGRGGWQLDGRVGPLLNDAEQHTCLCWQPFGPGLPPVLLLGSTNGAKVWMYEEALMGWREVKTLAHDIPVASVEWQQSGGRPQELVAMAQDTKVQILGLKGAVDQLQVEEVAELGHPSVVVKVGWHPLGWLAVSLKVSLVHLWRANLAGEWHLIRRLVGTPEAEV